MRTHTGENTYQCSQCKYAFSWNTELTYHLNIHTEENAYHYSKCGKSLTNENNLINPINAANVTRLTRKIGFLPLI